MAAAAEAKESWQNSLQGSVCIKQFDVRGQLIDTLIPAGRVFHVTREERSVNQEMAANPTLDMFSNGYLVPVRLIEDSEDAEELRSNPNLISETEMGELFHEHWRKFDERLAEISNAVVLGRLLEMARNAETGATVRQCEAIEARIAEVSPNAANEHEVLGDGRSLALKPVTPI